MIKKIAWNTFKNTGDVNTFLELKQFQEIQTQMQVPNEIKKNMQQQMEAQNGNNQNEWHNNF